MSRSALVMATAWLALCCAMVLAGMALRLSPVELAVLQPALPGSVLNIAALVTAAVAVVLFWVASGHARGLGLQVPLAELVLFFPLVFAYVWLILPGQGPRPVDLALLGVFLAGAAWLFRNSPRRKIGAASTAGRNLPVDLVLILAPVILGLVLGARPDWKASGISILLYPAYAIVQLAVFLVIPAGRLGRFGLTTRHTSFFCAAAFALVHAPNPVVVAATFVAMFIWTSQYLAGRRGWQLALVMGLSATTFSQFLPDDFTGHVRVGPGYLQAQAVESLARARYTTEQNQPRAFMELIYPETVGRRASADELDLWEDIIGQAMRAGRAWQFFLSEEYARKSAELGWPPPPDGNVLWLDYPPEWRDRIHAYTSGEYLARCGGDWTGFTKCLYRDILQRSPGSEELAGWDNNLNQVQRKRLARILLAGCNRFRNQPFGGMSVAELRLWP
jgi:hypothetical protein